MEPFFDLYVEAPPDFDDLPPPPKRKSPRAKEAGVVPTIPDGARGAVLHGKTAVVCRERLERLCPEGVWRHAQPLSAVVSADDARFPSASTHVICLRLPEEEWELRLRKPESWWPLCESLRRTNCFLRLETPPDAEFRKRWMVGVKGLARCFPETHFLLDPFLPGPVPGWQGGVKLAEQENVSLTTLGLLTDGKNGRTVEQTEEALRFTAGEVGAAMLFYASGCAWKDWTAGADRAARERLRRSKSLDVVEKQLVLYLNAEEFFAENGGGEHGGGEDDVSDKGL